MESEWEFDRIKLYKLRQDYPDLPQKELAQQMGKSLSWVKKWLKRFKNTDKPSLKMFMSQPRTPKTNPKAINKIVKEAILDLRDSLKDKYKRVPGAKTILYELHKNFADTPFYMPKSQRKVWEILKEGGRIPTKVREHTPIERPEPLDELEMDFGQIGDEIEFMSVIDRGTSFIPMLKATTHFNAETALLAVIQLFILLGLPRRLRFDRDTRFVGSWSADDFPSPLMRLLWCLGVEPVVTDAGKPQQKPFVERSIRTIKYECLFIERPANWLEATEILEVFIHFYNHERAHQSLVCGNRPPLEAFPNLPQLPQIPVEVDPDIWLMSYHKQVFKRRVAKNGSIEVGKHDYYVGYALAGETVAVVLDAQQRIFQILHHNAVVKELEIRGLVGHKMSFEDYVKHICSEAQTE